MTATWRIVDPIADVDTRGQPASLAPRIDTLRGKRIGLLDNGWRSMDTLLPAFRDLLQQRDDVSQALLCEKRSDGIGAPKAMLDDLARDSDFVINGLGN
ncbi:MAG: hypothetical protein Q7T26_02285 [Dehalococcoidia bacterium]|nr:hypothetical protein [Dehalococcoidia bacterium]